MTDQMAGDAEERRRLRVEMAAELGVPLYRRYIEPEAAPLLDLIPDELQAIRLKGSIGYLHLTASKVGYFGFQLIDYLLAAIIAPGRPAIAPEPRPPLKPAAKPPAPGQMLLSVPEAATQLGIGRSKLYELIGEGRLQVVRVAVLRHENKILRQERELLKTRQPSSPARQVDDLPAHRREEGGNTG